MIKSEIRNLKSITAGHLVKSEANMFISSKKYKCSQNLFIFFLHTVASCIHITNICYLILTPSMWGKLAFSEFWRIIFFSLPGRLDTFTPEL